MRTALSFTADKESQLGMISGEFEPDIINIFVLFEIMFVACSRD